MKSMTYCTYYYNLLLINVLISNYSIFSMAVQFLDDNKSFQDYDVAKNSNIIDMKSNELMKNKIMDAMNNESKEDYTIAMCDAINSFLTVANQIVLEFRKLLNKSCKILVEDMCRNFLPPISNGFLKNHRDAARYKSEDSKHFEKCMIICRDWYSNYSAIIEWKHRHTLENYIDIVELYFKKLSTIITYIDLIRIVKKKMEDDFSNVQINAFNLSKLCGDLISQVFEVTTHMDNFSIKKLVSFVDTLIFTQLSIKSARTWNWHISNITLCTIHESLKSQPDIDFYTKNTNWIKTLHYHTIALQDKINVVIGMID